MTLLLSSMTLVTAQKQLPKKHSHVKEAIKIQFIKELMRLYRNSPSMTLIDFEKSIYENGQWTIHFVPESRAQTLPEIVASVMEKWYFSNLSKNENIYFYRFLNIFRSLMSVEEWTYCENFHLEHSDMNLRENTRVYCDYRRKLAEIEQMVKVHL